MKKCVLVAALIAVSVSSFAQTAPGFPVYEPAGAAFVYAPAGASDVAGNGITRMIADDVNFVPGFAGQDIFEVGFILRNNATTSLSFRPRIRFWNADSATLGPTGVGNPGTYFASPAAVGYTFNPLTQAAGNSTFWLGLLYNTLSSAPSGFKVSSGTMWSGMVFDNNLNGTGATLADLNNLQMFVQNPLNGSSTNSLFQTTSPGSFFNVANPAGAQFQFTGTNPPNGNLGWYFSVQGQGYTGTINLGSVDPAPAVARTITVKLWANGNIINTTPVLFQVGTSAVSSALFEEVTTLNPQPNFPWLVGPAVLPTGATTLKMIVGGASFLDKVVTLTVPNPANPVTASPGIDFGTITLVNGDVDQNGEVDLTDIDLIIADYLTAGGTAEGTITDLDANGEVDLTDIDISIGNYLAADELP